MNLLSQVEGLFAETTAGVIRVGLRRLVSSGVNQREEFNVACITGAEFKNQEAMAEIVQTTVNFLGSAREWCDAS